MNKNEQLKALKKKIILLQLFSIPSAVALGLGVYGVFVADSHAFIAALNNRLFCYALIMVGGVVELLMVIKLLPLLQEQMKINNSKSLQ